MNINYLKLGLFLLQVLLVISTCTERKRDNPLDPGANGQSKISLSVLSHSNHIKLDWNKITLTDFVGFNIYRKDDTSSTFSIFAQIQDPNQTSYTDNAINHFNTYSYYITIQGATIESAPSNMVKTTPGPGYNWIVDKYGYQLIKTTYDNRYQVNKYYTEWRPQDIAIDTKNKIALITQPTGYRIDIINTETTKRDTFYTDRNRYYIDNPYLVEFDSKFNNFWVSDSGGALYKISSTDYSISLIQSTITKPDEIFIEHKTGFVYIIDDISNSIYQFGLDGSFIANISRLSDYEFINPIKFAIDSLDNRFWLIDRINNKDHIYTGFIDSIQTTFVDSFDIVFAMEINPINHYLDISVYLDDQSKVMQLSHTGDRHLDLSGFYSPYHVTHNRYDGSLLVTDSGNGRVIHYKEGSEILGIFNRLNFPVRVEVE